MPPRAKYQKEEIAGAALEIARREGIGAVTAREVAAKLGISPRPIFTWFDSMDQLREEVRLLARDRYRIYLERGLGESIPFLGIWRQYLRFAWEEPELYRLLYLTGRSEGGSGALESLRFSQDLARESIMRIYDMDAYTADCFFRDLWLAAFSYGTLIVTGDCPYTEEEILSVGTEISLSVCKAYKEIPGLPEGRYDRDALFRELLQKEKGDKTAC